MLVIDGANLDLHVAALFVTPDRLALVVERAAGKACCLQQVRQFMLVPHPLTLLAVPQSAKQNSGPWAKIEKDTRLYASRAKGDVFVITGPVFEAGATAIDASQVRVPSHLYKLVYGAQTGRAWAHWQANPDSTKAGELVRRTGINFLPVVPRND